MKELGTENFYIELIEYCRCSTSEELRKREGELIRAHKPDWIEKWNVEEKQEYYLGMHLKEATHIRHLSDTS
jgi:hypothetical protein